MALRLKRMGAALLLLSMFLLSPAWAEGRDFLVDADWLAAEKQSNKDLVILEVRYHPHRYNTVGHIEGAVQVKRFKDLGDNLGSPIMRFPAKNVFEKTLRSWGINNSSTVVIYDDSSTALASRLYGTLELFGYDMSKVKILDGGTIGWTGFNELTKESTPTPKEGNVTLKDANPKMLVEWMAVYDDVVSRRAPNVVLVDARPADMYTGKVIKHAVQGGHIPGAINIVSIDGTDGQTQLWKSAEDIAALYKDIPNDKTVYIYCHDGFRMSLGWLQLKNLGYKDVRFLNGGWGVWDRAMTLPVVQGDNAYDEEYAL
ncbi:MAG: rhodanese-like domain-containing protein [Thiothrix sp.]|uniref:sulfurtransferase n=1 Tax=Thiothrix sp. TaxID=1032 RepID=UPI002613B87D|nr:rhodanese-like domain-containing protein [Thiothrix sp.]MDD5393207.1 rhodanese-like domain-containing protein [Thiothrix sp.]